MVIPVAQSCRNSVIHAFGSLGTVVMACAVAGCTAPLNQLAERPIVVDSQFDGRSRPIIEANDRSIRLSPVDRLIPPQQDPTSTAPPETDVAVADEPEASAAVDWGPKFSLTAVEDSAFSSAAGAVVKASRTVVDAQPVSSEAASDTWNLQDLRSLAMLNNPAIRQAAGAASEADGVHNQTGLRPNPTVSYLGDEIGNEGQAGLHGIRLSQTFVRGGKLAWNQQVVGHEVQIRRWNEKVQRQRALTDVRLHFITALAAQRRLELTREFRKVAQQGVRVSEQRVKGKFAGRADILQSEMQLSQVDLAIQQTELQLDAAWKQLAAVVGLPDLVRRPLLGELEPNERTTNPDEVLPELLSDSPLLAAAQHQVSRARANLERQRVQKTPNVTAQLGTGHDDATGNSFASVQLSIPVPVHNRNQGNVHAAWGEYCRATQNVRRMTMQIRRDLAAELRDYQSALAAVTQYRDVIIPKAEETLELMKLAQAGGEYDFLRVLTARRAFFDASINQLKATQNMSIADARIEGRLLTGGLSSPDETPLSTGLRGQALSQQ